MCLDVEYAETDLVSCLMTVEYYPADKGHLLNWEHTEIAHNSEVQRTGSSKKTQY